MRKLTLRSIWNHKRRLISTIISVVLGVAFLVGTYVFSDTLTSIFDDLVETANEEVDARVQGEPLFDLGAAGGEIRGRFADGVVADVEGVEGVEGVAPGIFAIGGGPTNRVLDPDGEPIGPDNGAPTLVENWIEDEALSSYNLTEGSRGPESDDEIALNVGAAEEGGYEVGDSVRFISQFGFDEYTLVGTFTFGDDDTAVGAVSANFTLTEAQRLAGADGQLDNILVRGSDDVTQQELVGRIGEVLPDGTEVISGDEATEQDKEAFQANVAFFQVILTIFITIALVVATFIIANTFQILVAQRTRELALLRAVGASREQVLGSVLLEAVVIGLVAAVLGILVGIVLAFGITAVLSAIGLELPDASLVVKPATIIVGLVVGLVVTVVSAISPAVKATRVPPLAALRDVAIDRSGASKVRLVAGALALVLAAINLSAAWRGDDQLGAVGLGCGLLVLGAILIGPVVASPSIRSVGWPLPRARGVTGRLAVENAARSPKRTSATASALIIGVALIGFVTVFAESAKASVEEQINRGVTAEVFVQPGGAFGGPTGLSPEVAATVAEVPGVDVVARFAGDLGSITYPDGDSTDTFVGGVDPADYGRVARPTITQGELEDLQPGGVILHEDIVEDHDLAIGDTVEATFNGGATATLEVQAVSDDPFMLLPVTFHLDDLSTYSSQALDFQVLASVDDGADVDAVVDDVTDALEVFPGVTVLDRDGYIGTTAASLSALVNVIYGLLALSLVIAMIGVANTLSLSVHERTRELGLLRAVGMTRQQLKSAIRWEAVMIALLGTLVGLAIGLVSSYALITALESEGLTAFKVPVLSWPPRLADLGVQVVIAAGLAVLASWFAARRAAKLDVLDAIATE